MPGRYFKTEFVLSTKFPAFDIYIDHIWKYFWLPFPSNGQEFKKFLAVARHGQAKMFPNMVNIYIKLLEI